MVQKKTGDYIFNFLNYLLFIILAATVIVPLWMTLVSSISTEQENIANELRLWPKKVDFAGYNYVFNDQQSNIFYAFFITMLNVIIGTSIHIVLSSMAGYVLAVHKIKGRGLIMTFIIAAMVIPFQLLMAPLYILFRQMGLINNIWVLIFNGNMIGAYTIILIRNYFSEVPKEMHESATIDGAHDFRIFWQIYVPVSLPGMATITIFQILARWNEFMTGYIFIHDTIKQPLQVVVGAIVAYANYDSLGVNASASADMFGSNVRAAAAMIIVVPMILIYPYMQKFFIKGIKLGSVKG
jgi:putative aldouronate transport system permease protein